MRGKGGRALDKGAKLDWGHPAPDLGHVRHVVRGASMSPVPPGAPLKGLSEYPLKNPPRTRDCFLFPFSSSLHWLNFFYTKYATLNMPPFCWIPGLDTQHPFHSEQRREAKRFSLCVCTTLADWGGIRIRVPPSFSVLCYAINAAAIFVMLHPILFYAHFQSNHFVLYYPPPISHFMTSVHSTFSQLNSTLGNSQWYEWFDRGPESLRCWCLSEVFKQRLDDLPVTDTVIMRVLHRHGGLDMETFHLYDSIFIT